MSKKSKQIEGQLELFSLMEKTEKIKEIEQKEQPKQHMSVTSFSECRSCWCRDCKHNVRTEAVPRDLCGKMLPCPACEGCFSEGKAEICEIGSAKNGCHTRALEEGIPIS